MANGDRKAISEVEVGDYVYATDPETGESGPREVVATLPHTDQLLTLRTSSGDVVTTEDHKYWNATDGEWQESQHLDEGDQLLTADGDEVTVDGLDWTTVHTDAAYDLTIDDLHTFYVAAGDEAVLVHNCWSAKEKRIVDYLSEQGRRVEKNTAEGVEGAGRQGDSFVDGVKTEFKSMDPGATDSTMLNRAQESMRRGGQARNIVFDGRGTGLTEAQARHGISRIQGVSAGRLDSVEVIGDGFFIRTRVR